jgi:antitoxin VapB
MADREGPVDAREELRAIRERCRKLPVLDNRPPDQILGYDDNGLPR